MVPQKKKTDDVIVVVGQPPMITPGYDDTVLTVMTKTGDDDNDNEDDKAKLVSKDTDTTVIQIQGGVRHSEKRYCCGLCKGNPHVMGVILNLAVWVAITFTFVSWVIYRLAIANSNCDPTIDHTCDPGPPELQAKFETSWKILIFVYMLYALEVLASGTSLYLWNLSVVEDVESYINVCDIVTSCSVISD